MKTTQLEVDTGSKFSPINKNSLKKNNFFFLIIINKKNKKIRAGK